MAPPPPPLHRHRVVVLGTGAMGQRHVRVLAGLRRRFTVAGVYDVDRAVAESVGGRWRVPVFQEEAAALDAADLVVIASPIAAHADTAFRAIEAGKHVLVEKPLAASASDAVALARATKPGQHLFVGHSERFNAVVRALRAVVPPGDVRMLTLRRVTTPALHRYEQDVLLSLGVHDLDLAGYLTQSVTRLHEARAVTSPASMPTADAVGVDAAELVVRSASGATCRIYLDRASRTRERSIEVATSSGRYSGNLLVPRLLAHERGRTRDHQLCEIEPLVTQAAAVATALEGGSIGDLATGLAGARAIALAEQARQWLEPGREQRVSEAS